MRIAQKKVATWFSNVNPDYRVFSHILGDATSAETWLRLFMSHFWLKCTLAWAGACIKHQRECISLHVMVCLQWLLVDLIHHKKAD